jgi:hypothetical protein
LWVLPAWQVAAWRESRAHSRTTRRPGGWTHILLVAAHELAFLIPPGDIRKDDIRKRQRKRLNTPFSRTKLSVPVVGPFLNPTIWPLSLMSTMPVTWTPGASMLVFPAS